MMEENDNSLNHRVTWYVFAIILIIMSLMPLLIVSETANKNYGTEGKTILELMFHKK